MDESIDRIKQIADAMESFEEDETGIPIRLYECQNCGSLCFELNLVSSKTKESCLEEKAEEIRLCKHHECQLCGGKCWRVDFSRYNRCPECLGECILYEPTKEEIELVKLLEAEIAGRG